MEKKRDASGNKNGNNDAGLGKYGGIVMQIGKELLTQLEIQNFSISVADKYGKRTQEGAWSGALKNIIHGVNEMRFIFHTLNTFNFLIPSRRRI